MALRLDFEAEVAQRVGPPQFNDARLCLADVDAGALAQTGLQLHSLARANWRRFHISVTDPYYPSDLCGTWELQRGDWARTPPADDAGTRRLDGAGVRALAANAALALPDFIEALGVWALHSGHEVVMAAFRSTDGYRRAVADGAVPAPTLVLGVDLEAAIDVELPRANQLGGRDAHGAFEVLLPSASPPLVQRTGPPRPLDALAAPPGGVEAALAALPGSATRTARATAVRELAGATVRPRDNALLRLADVAALALPEAPAALLFGATCTYGRAEEYAGAAGVVRLCAHAQRVQRGQPSASGDHGTQAAPMVTSLGRAGAAAPGP